METYESGYGKEIAGLLGKKKIEEYDDTKSKKLRSVDYLVLTEVVYELVRLM